MYRLKQKSSGIWLETTSPSEIQLGHARWVSRGFLVHKDKRGANTVPFSGCLKGKALHRGRYRLKLVAGVGGTNSAPVAKSFAITHRSAKSA